MTLRQRPPRREAPDSSSSGYTEAARYATALCTVRDSLNRVDWPDPPDIRMATLTALPYRYKRLRKAFPQPSDITTADDLRRALIILLGVASVR